MGSLSQTLLIHRIARKESGPFFSLYHPYPLTNSGIHLQSCIRYPLTNIQIFICSITFDIIDSLLCLIAVHIVTILLLSRIVLLLEITISMNLKFILYACWFYVRSNDRNVPYRQALDWDSHRLSFYYYKSNDRDSHWKWLEEAIRSSH